MGREIERKFLVTSDSWRGAGDAVRLCQGYLTTGPPVSVRVRREGSRAWLNLKESTLEIGRAEWDYEIPAADAEALLSMCVGGLIEKTRHYVRHGAHLWEIDVFEGENSGLVLAEIELGDENEHFDLPPWAGEEVSLDPRYRNTYLSGNPYRTWPGRG